MKVAHTNFAKVSRMETVNVGAVMMETTSETTTTGMLTVLADTTMTGGNVSSLFAILLVDSGLCRTKG